MKKPKKIKEEPEKKPKKEPKKEKVEKYRCHVGEQWKDFDTQKDAREMAKDILNCNRIFFVTLSRVQEDEE